MLNRFVRPQLFAAGVLAVLAALLIACDDQPEEAVQDVSKATATDSPAVTPPQPTASSTTVSSPTPSPVPRDVLLAAAQLIPTPVGANSKGGYDGAVYDDFDSVAGRGFYSSSSPEKIIRFYDEQLTAAGWLAEGDSTYWFFEEEENDPCPSRVVHWSFTNGDLRLLIGAQLSPGYMRVGDVPWVITVQPLWYHVSDMAGWTRSDAASAAAVAAAEPPGC